MTTPDPTARFLSGDSPFPFGQSLRQHMQHYVEGIPHLIKLGTAEVKDLQASAADLPEGDPLREDYFRRADQSIMVNRTMEAVHKDLSHLLEFVDWEHEFHNVGPTDLRPGMRALFLKLVQGVDPGTFKIAIEIHNGNMTGARLDMSRDEVVQTVEALTSALGVMDDAAAHHESGS